jgi:hypothetical protein
MAQPQEEGFKVTDRRRRDDEPTPTREAPERGTPRGQPAPHPGEKRTLADLFMMLATEAVVALGEAPDPVSGQRQRVLPHAAEMIDLLLLLREKTEGNRTADETQILEDVIYDLQLRYVRATKSAG